MNRYGNPFPRSPRVVEELERDGMLQDSAPLPWRDAELEFLKKGLDLQGHGFVTGR
jgi:hypothetical protein